MLTYIFKTIMTMKFKVENGDLTVSSYGPNSVNLGAAVIYNASGSVIDEYVIPIAGKTDIDSDPYVGPWNLYSPEKENAHKSESLSVQGNNGLTETSKNGSEILGRREPLEGYAFNSSSRAARRDIGVDRTNLGAGKIASADRLYVQSDLSYAERLLANRGRR